MAERLPIENMTEQNFAEFKRKHLDGEFLSEEALTEMRNLFGFPHNLESGVAYINCDEAEEHTYKCLHIRNPTAGIVERLYLEVRKYQYMIEQIRKLTEKTK